MTQEARLLAAFGPEPEWPERHFLPPALAKACNDPFDYALRLVTGEVIFFNEAELHGQWVHLKGCGVHSANDGSLRAHHRNNTYGHDDEYALPIEAARGLDVRIDHIVWCADAPDGS